jgi:DNA adenine methylase
MLAANPPKPLTAWFGGKARLGKIIAEKLPEHRIYVEPYGGMAGVLMAKYPSEVEVYNDLHSGVVALFRVVRDPVLCQQLLNLLDLTPYAREEWRDCNATWESETNLVEKARKVYVTLSQNFVGATAGGSWSFGGIKYDGNVVSKFYNSFDNIKAVCQRLKQVQVENFPATDVIKRWDSPETCFYLDPPYLPETRQGKNVNDYKHELTTGNHLELIDLCLSLKGKVILSGYPSETYDKALLEEGWIREDFQAMSSAALQSNANGLKGKPADKAKRIESLWISPNAQQKTLWNSTEEVAV